MPNRRSLIEMTKDEIAAFLGQPHTLSLATNTVNGFPHLTAMWYGFFTDGRIGMWSYGKSQKVKNIERNPKIGILIETGLSYDQLKGVYIAAEAEIIADPEVVLQIGSCIYERYFGTLDKDGLEAVSYMGRKRVAIGVNSVSMTSWDHSKLNGSY